MTSMSSLTRDWKEDPRDSGASAQTDRTFCLIGIVAVTNKVLSEISV